MNFFRLSEQMSNAAYTAIVLDEPSKALLLSHFPSPEGWEKICHHMTINMGSADKGPAANLLGQKVHMTVTSLAQDDKVMAVGVETTVPSSNARKHVTIAVNRSAGGKPFHSNLLSNWQATKPMVISGTVMEVGR